MNITFWEVLLVVLVIVLLFGGKKIPELMKGLGKGVKSFKEGMRETEEEINSIDTPSKDGDAKKEGQQDKKD
jgi:sec-independent protein translocase protein TatA